MSFDVNITVQRGDRQITAQFCQEEPLVALVGHSGAGKTSILHCIAGLLRPDSGQITIGGKALFDSEQGVDLPPDERRCGYVFQDARLFPHLTVSANLDYGARLARYDPPLSRDAAIDLLGLSELLKRTPDTLSGGETRRVAIGRALLSAPRLLLLDEPLASLDSDRRDKVLAMIERIRDTLAIPILYVGHDRGEVARLTQQVIVIPQS